MAFEFVMVGTVRNVVYGKLLREITRLERAFPRGSNFSWYLVESNSDPRYSLRALTRVAEAKPGLKFVSLGADGAGTRIERISRARNEYLRFLRTEYRASPNKHAFCVVVDLDGINKKLKIPPNSLNEIETLNEAHFANQTGPYYDISALRHSSWVPSDPWADYADLEPKLGKALAFKLAVQSKQISIPPNAAKIAVDSAFGGLGIYPLKALIHSKAIYSVLEENGAQVCEHVNFHQSLRREGVALFIYPSMTNARFTEHTRYLAPFLGKFLKLRSHLATLLPEKLHTFLVRLFFSN